MLQVKTFQVNPFMENTYLVYDETGEALLIDCGALYPEEEATIKEFIEEKKLTVKRLLNTHLHLDHQFGNHFAAQAFGVLPEAHVNDEPLIDQMQGQAMLFGVPGKITPQKLGRHIAEGEKIAFGNSAFTAIHVPGHSKGSLCFYSADSGMLFVGDVLFAGGIGRTDLPGGSYEQLIGGINSKLLVLPDNTVVYSGHGPTTTIGNERRDNPFL